MGILKMCSYVSKSRNTYLSEDEKTRFIDKLGFHFNMERVGFKDFSLPTTTSFQSFLV